MIRFKAILYQTYGYVALVMCAAGAVLAYLNHSTNWLSLVPTGLGLAYFVQKQQLDELQLFHSLFGEFNRRYDGMNAKLQDVLASPGRVTPAERNVLLEYFNLCAEEYFFWTRGAIPGVVWNAWCRGMLEYLSDERIARLWDEEAAKGSHYGLSREIIEEGSGRVPSSVPAAPVRIADAA